MRCILPILVSLAIGVSANAQTWEAQNHPNNGKKAIVFNGKQISDYIYSEISELSEGKAYVAKGGLYAYVDTNGNELTAYRFAVATNFRDGYAIVGDSSYQYILSSKMKVMLPKGYLQVRLPEQNMIIVQSQSGLWGALDMEGKLKIPTEYDLPPKVLSGKNIIVRKEEQYGVITEGNDVRFNCYYQLITNDGFAYKKGKYLRLF